MPDPISFEYLDRFLSHLTTTSFVHIRWNDFEFLANLFHQLFCFYRRDIRLCERIMSFFHLFLQRIQHKVRTHLSNHDDWSQLSQRIDAFWQMTLNRNSSLNSQLRRSIIQIKRVLINDEEEMAREELQSLLDDPSYFVRLEANRLCLHLFDQSNGEQSTETEDHASLGFFFGAKETSDDRRLKTTNEQEKLYRSLMEQNSSSLHLLCQLAPRSEYLSRQVVFRLIELNMEHKLSNELLQGILPSVPIEALLQSWHRQTAYSINEFPWTSFGVTSIERTGALKT